MKPGTRRTLRDMATFVLPAVLVVLILVTVIVLVAAAYGAPDDERGKRVVICHATESADNPYVQLVIAEEALAGHFDNNGTPLAGHEGDYMGPCRGNFQPTTPTVDTVSTTTTSSTTTTIGGTTTSPSTTTSTTTTAPPAATSTNAPVTTDGGGTSPPTSTSTTLAPTTVPTLTTVPTGTTVAPRVLPATR